MKHHVNRIYDLHNGELGKLSRKLVPQLTNKAGS